MSLTRKELGRIPSKKVTCDCCGKKISFNKLRKEGKKLLCSHCYFK